MIHGERGPAIGANIAAGVKGRGYADILCMWYLLIKLLHVLAAAIAVGANVTYAIWIAAGSRDPKTLPFALRGVKLIDDRLANPAYGLLLITGVAMVLVG
jgi:uncharacterized membrane protein